ncbi:FEZ-like protein [Parelaphostrongylus tenuis]|uniref:FEZ-like protein n=1 Tax=Parelaphostrongylus tenuis TaxID=148309 RepID=A0AAD5R6U3_PARTN|nr:FEZ-like protein [Parelaphostrongylus tenuis]
MEAGDLRVPEIPLASGEDDLDSNKNSQHEDESNHVSSGDEVRLHEDLSSSLEDLVGNFDERISSCLKNPDVNTEDIAPVQIRTQDEIMAESQTWWTLTCSFGNIQPLDFDKSAIRRRMMPALDLQERKLSDDGGVSLSDEEELRARMDMHQLVSHGSIGSDSPPQTADQVIEEIDEMLQSCDFTGSMMTDRTMESVDTDMKLRQAQAFVANPENLNELSLSKLVTLTAEMEQLIQVYNESLVDELAHRDELEYEKEMKNTFISLLLSIQNKRRQFVNERKRKGTKIDPLQLPQYMTASIPYNDHQHMDNNTLASLIKILRAINNDSFAVPTLLTDYILTVVCPKTVTC